MPAYRAAIYARFSNDHQRDASIEDQFRVCRQLAESKGWTVVRTFADRAISGATQHRPQFQELQAEAKAGQFDIVISESLDRLSTRKL
jgi:DNA invertase Pin-like site-specific DNA recombinase